MEQIVTLFHQLRMVIKRSARWAWSQMKTTKKTTIAVAINHSTCRIPFPGVFSRACVLCCTARLPPVRTRKSFWLVALDDLLFSKCNWGVFGPSDRTLKYYANIWLTAWHSHILDPYDWNISLAISSFQSYTDCGVGYLGVGRERLN